MKITESIPVEQAATIAPATVALHGLRLVKVEAGRSVAVRGRGITGRYASGRNCWGRPQAVARAAGADAGVTRRTARRENSPPGWTQLDCVLACRAQSRPCGGSGRGEKGLCRIGTSKSPDVPGAALGEHQPECVPAEGFPGDGAWGRCFGQFPGEE